jgi:hypothetical protein
VELHSSIGSCPLQAFAIEDLPVIVKEALNFSCAGGVLTDGPLDKELELV